MTLAKSANRADQLDALRGLAVIAVILCHTLPSTYLGNWDLTEIGSFAVYAFFVLSGFLITSLLLGAKDEWRNSDESLISPILNFYIRRALRLYPVYYITLGVACLLNVPNIRSEIWFHVFQASNWLYANDVDYWTWGLHFWTLAIEAQFYLVLPWLVFVLSTRNLERVFWLMLAVGAISWLPENWFGIPQPLLNTGTLQSMDCLALGGLMAIAKYRQRPILSLASKALVPLVVATIVSWLPMVFLQDEIAVVAEALNHQIMNVAFACLIYLCTRGMSGRLGALLDQRVLIKVGLVSYAIYVLHPFAIWAQVELFARVTGEPGEPWGLPLSLSTFAISLVAAICSWAIVERPAARMRSAFRVDLPANRVPRVLP